MNCIFGIGKENIVAADLLKIGEIKVKDKFISIYNIHLQVNLSYKDSDEELTNFTISLGNLNITGLE